MAKTYVIKCRDAGVDCDFEARGSSADAVVEQCAEHAMREHGMTGFGTELYVKMRWCLKTLDVEDTPAQKG